MSNQLTPEIAALYGALDSNVAFNGSPVDAHLLRTMAMSANRLGAKGHQALRVFFNASSITHNGDAAHVYRGDTRNFAALAWEPLFRTRMPVKKKPGLSQYEAQVTYMGGINSLNMRIQVVTHRAPFISSIAGPNIITLAGSPGAASVASLTQIPADPSADDEISVYIQGDPTTNVPALGGGGGTPGFGAITTFNAEGTYGVMTHTGAAWTTSGTSTFANQGSYFVVQTFVGASWVTVGGPYIVKSVDSATQMTFFPAPTPDEWRRINQAGGASVCSFQLYLMQEVFIYDFVLHLMDRTV